MIIYQKWGEVITWHMNYTKILYTKFIIKHLNDNVNYYTSTDICKCKHSFHQNVLLKIR